eukprot:1173458-Alexandrium_andersonii.AAC.1
MPAVVPALRPWAERQRPSKANASTRVGPEGQEAGLAGRKGPTTLQHDEELGKLLTGLGLRNLAHLVVWARHIAL